MKPLGNLMFDGMFKRTLTVFDILAILLAAKVGTDYGWMAFAFVLVGGVTIKVAAERVIEHTLSLAERADHVAAVMIAMDCDQVDVTIDDLHDVEMYQVVMRADPITGGLTYRLVEDLIGEDR